MSSSISIDHMARGPEGEVARLLADAQRHASLHPIIAALFSKHEQLFLDVFRQQVELIQSRSQSFEDAQVTVYDKVLLALTKDGDDLENTAAMIWFSTEYLGFNPAKEDTYNKGLIQRSLALPVALARVRRDSQPAPSGVSPPPSSPHRPDDRSDRIRNMRNDVGFTRLWRMYEDALNEYIEVAGERSHRTADAARFLRDTAENGIQYLERLPSPDETLISELRRTFHRANRAVEALAGGRRRRFDRALESTTRSGLVGNQSPPARSHQAGSQNDDRPRELFPPMNSTPRPSPRFQHRHRRSRPERPLLERPPWGYSRQVDSYVPSRRQENDRPRRSRYSESFDSDNEIEALI